MSKQLCNIDCKSSPNSPNHAYENRCDLALVMGWFKKLNVGDQKDFIREIHSKVQGVSIEMLPSESEEDFRLRSFEELFKRHPSSSQRTFGFKVFKAYVRSHGHSKLHQKKPVSHVDDESNLLKLDQLFKSKSLDGTNEGSKGGKGCLKQVSSADEQSSLKLELFRMKTFEATGGTGSQGGQGSSNNQQ